MPKAKRSSRGRDRKLVAGVQRHEVSYTSRKAGVKGRAVKKAVNRIGNSRRKVERALSRSSKAKARPSLTGR